ncbi:transcriptional regulator with XRE-family HTH domain [Alkalibacillus flavidus]|uniref:Transcriptional regulator with XRE-family HTH domain n=1 Tax=Alkalibacillus flavidus TaxID=546021 RepID=A0ABV2KWE9_9BACI
MFNTSSFIQYHRTKQGLSQKQLATGICSISYLSKIENKIIEPSQSVFESLCERLGIPAHSIESASGSDIEDDIETLYKLITKKNFTEAHDLYETIQATLSPFHHDDVQHFFKLIELYYLIETKSDRVTNYAIDNLFNIQSSFQNKKRYYFYKIIGIYYIHLAYPHQAIVHFIEAENVLDEYGLNDPDLYYLIAATYTRLYEPSRSNHYCQIAKEQFINTFLYPKITDCYILFGINYTLLQAFDIAEHYFFQVLNSRPMMDSERVTANLQYNIAYLYIEKEDWDKALTYLTSAYEGFNTSYEKLRCLQLFAKIHYHLQEYDTAISYINQGETLSQQIGDQKIRCLLWMLTHEINQTVATNTFLLEAKQQWIPYLVQRGENRTLKELYILMAESLMAQQNHRDAITYYEKILKLGI